MCRERMRVADAFKLTNNEKGVVGNVQCINKNKKDEKTIKVRDLI